MRYILTFIALLCGAASAAAAEEVSGEFQAWCSKDGQIINQIEDGLFMGGKALDAYPEDVITGDYSVLIYKGVTFTPCESR